MTFPMPVTGEVSGSAQLTGGADHPVSLDLQLSGVALQPSSVYIVRFVFLSNEPNPCILSSIPGGVCPVIGVLNVDADGNAAGSWSSAPHGSVLPLPTGGNPALPLGANLQALLANPVDSGGGGYGFFLALEEVPATTDSTVKPGTSAIYLGPALHK